MTPSTPPPPDPSSTPQTRRERLEASRAGRHDPRWRLVLAGVALLAVVGLLVAFLRPGGGDGSARLAGGGACERPTGIRVATTTEMEPVVREVASRIGPSACASYDIGATSPADVLTALASPDERPHLWIPDSSVWVRRAQTQQPGLSLSAELPFAVSPIVAAAPKTDAAALTGDGGVTWNSLFASPSTLRLADPSTTSAGLIALLSAHSARAATPTSAATDAPMGQALFQASRQMPAQGSTLPAEQAASASGTYLVSEQQFSRYTGEHADSPLVGLPLAEGSIPLDYPTVAVPSTQPGVAEAVRLLGNGLRDREGQELLQRSGFRLPGRDEGPQVPTADGPGKLTTSLLPMPSDETIRRAVTQWRALTAGLRLLTVIDTSGSMRHGQTPGGNRIELAAAAAIRGASILPPNTDVGVWEFSNGRGKQGNWRELVPVAPLSKGGDTSHRDRTVAALGTLPQRLGGDTPLYGTVLDAVARLHEGHDDSRINAIILMTDGRNDTPGGIGLDQLLTSLRLSMASGKDVSIVAIAIGPEADRPALQRIAEASDGQFFVAKDPTDIERILVQALMRFHPSKAAAAATPMP